MHYYAENCKIYCTDKDETLEAEIFEFKPNVYLNVRINGIININLRYQPKHNNYVGSMSGYEFTTKGPKLL